MTSRAFWWEPPWWIPAANCAPAGWYKWTERGLVYLGVTLNRQLFADESKV